ncbi:hypothetical protein MPC1_1180004 [Methylocella tundrae]|nr:hypothetical protein MPC1_1180004 [Methylocella tundrae]
MIDSASAHDGVGNLFDIAALDTRAEQFTPLVEAKNLKIERIVSAGQASPPGFWYDQDLAERVLFFFQAEDGIRDVVESRGLGDVYKRQSTGFASRRLVAHPREAKASRGMDRQIGRDHLARCPFQLMSPFEKAPA